MTNLDDFVLDGFADEHLLDAAVAAYNATHQIGMGDPDLELDPAAMHKAGLLAAVRTAVRTVLSEQLRRYAAAFERAGEILDVEGQPDDGLAFIDADLANLHGQAVAELRAAVDAARRGRLGGLPYPTSHIAEYVTLIGALRTVLGMPTLGGVEVPAMTELRTAAPQPGNTTAAEDALRLHLICAHGNLAAPGLNDDQAAALHAEQHADGTAADPHLVDDLYWSVDAVQGAYADDEWSDGGQGPDHGFLLLAAHQQITRITTAAAGGR